MDDLRYPVGRYAAPDPITPEHRAAWIAALEAAPAALRAAVEGLSDDRLDTPYRPGGWTVRQVVHHVPDSHLNAYVRFKLALTEDAPTIKPYEEARWAELPDSTGPVAPSLDLLDSLHARWVALLRAMPEEAWARTFFHPEQGRALRLDWTLGLYAWHGKHHAAHVTALRGREGW
jgi:hypothetical protein